MSPEQDVISDENVTRTARKRLMPIAAVILGLVASVCWWGFLAWKAVAAAIPFF